MVSNVQLTVLAKKIQNPILSLESEVMIKMDCKSMDKLEIYFSYLDQL